MTHEEIVALLRNQLNEIAAGEATDLPLDADLRDELDLDSMDLLQIVRALHERLTIDIPEVDYGRLDTLRNFAAYLESRLE